MKPVRNGGKSPRYVGFTHPSGSEVVLPPISESVLCLNQHRHTYPETGSVAIGLSVKGARDVWQQAGALAPPAAGRARGTGLGGFGPAGACRFNLSQKNRPGTRHQRPGHPWTGWTPFCDFREFRRLFIQANGRLTQGPRQRGHQRPGGLTLPAVLIRRRLPPIRELGPPQLYGRSGDAAIRPRRVTFPLASVIIRYPCRHGPPPSLEVCLPPRTRTRAA